jgi:hypothetical protein
LTPAPRRAGVFLWGKPQTLPRALVARLAGDEDAIWRAFDEITADFSEAERRKLFHANAAHFYRLRK